MSMLKKYISDESALDITVQQITFVVIALVVIAVVAFVVFNLMSDGTEQASQGQSDINNSIDDIKGLY